MDEHVRPAHDPSNLNKSNFGALLRMRRLEAGLSYRGLAEQSGLARATLVNLEQGITKPSPLTMRRLASVKALGLTELTSPQLLITTDTWFCEAYNPMALNHEMVRDLNGPGGQIDQSYLYLDPQSACDWYALSNNEEYVTKFRSQVPFDKIAERIMKEARGGGIDVDGLGCGDGKTETQLVLRLADLAPSTPPDLQLYLLDISHGLLSEAYRKALNALGPKRVPVIAIHGDFNHIARNPMLYMRPETVRRLRLFLLIGYTMGNIRDEPCFFRNLSACAQPGDLVIIDFTLARGSQPEQIRQMDPAIKAKKPAAIYHDFLSGPLFRYIKGCKSIKLRIELSTHCPVPGSYSSEAWAIVETDYEQARQFVVWRVKRYEEAQLSKFLLSFGWATLQSWHYGSDQSAAVLIAQKQ